MNLQLVDIRRDVSAAGYGGQSSLLHAEQGCRQGRDGRFAVLAGLQDLASRDTFPGRGDLDAHPFGFDIWVDFLEDLNNSYRRGRSALGF